MTFSVLNHEIAKIQPCWVCYPQIVRMIVFPFIILIEIESDKTSHNIFIQIFQRFLFAYKKINMNLKLLSFEFRKNHEANEHNNTENTYDQPQNTLKIKI